MTCAPRPPPLSPAPLSVPMRMPFSFTIRLKTSPTERTPSAGFQLYFPAMTRARPANLSESVPASFDRAACVVCALSGAGLSTAAIATAPAIVLVRIFLIDISWRRYGGARLFMTANEQFRKFIILTKILTARHDSVNRWEEVSQEG